MPESIRYCECGCGTQIIPSSSGRVKRFVKNHHRKGVSYTLEQRVERMKKRWKKESEIFPCVSKRLWCARKNNNRNVLFGFR